MPGDGKGDGRVEQDAEIVSVIRIFPKVIAVDDQPLADALLKANIELIAPARLDGRGLRSKYILSESAAAGAARKDQILVERSFKGARIGAP